MLQPRLYRATWLFGVVAVVVMMFSIVSRPAPLAVESAPEPFEGSEAAAEVRQLLSLAPEREPGSEGDRAVADLVRERFEGLEGGTVVRETFEGSFERREYSSENVIYALPGETEEAVVVIAPRDCAAGPCAASSASATAALLGLGQVYSRTHHRKTMIFVSTSGSVAGAAGARELARYLENRPVTAIVALAQVGTERLGGRFVVPWSTNTRQTSSQLVQSALAVVEAELSSDEPPHRGTASELLRLAIPAGLGEQAPLVAAGYDAIALSSDGDLPLTASADEDFSESTLTSMGETALSLTRALDEGPAELVHGPSARVPLSGKLVPGWALLLLAVALLLPLAGVALESVVRGRREGIDLLAGGRWFACLILPFLAGLALVYLLSLVRLLPAPEFPYDPSRFSPGIGGVIALVLIAAAVGAVFYLVLRRIPAPPDPETRTVTVGLGIFATGLITCLINPYLALILMPALHIWLHATPVRIRGGLGARLALIAVGLATLFLIAAGLGAQLGVGVAGALWQLLLMFTGGQFGLIAALPPLLLAACLAATLQLTGLSWTNVRGPSTQASSPPRPIEQETT